MRTSLEKIRSDFFLFGRIATVIGIILMVGFPVIVGFSYGHVTLLGDIGAAFLRGTFIFFISGIGECLIYSPMIGAGASYLGFLTGNVFNIRLPAIMNAREITGVESGSAENEVISTISAAVSNLVTTAVISLGVALLVPLKPLLENPVVAPAFENVIPALFGAMAVKYFGKNIKYSLGITLALIVMYVILPSLISSSSMLIIPVILIICAFSALTEKIKGRHTQAMRRK